MRLDQQDPDNARPRSRRSTAFLSNLLLLLSFAVMGYLAYPLINECFNRRRLPPGPYIVVLLDGVKTNTQRPISATSKEGQGAINHVRVRDAITQEPLTISRLMVHELEIGVNGPQIVFEMSPKTTGVHSPVMRVEVAGYKTFTAPLSHLLTCSRDLWWKILMRPLPRAT